MKKIFSKLVIIVLIFQVIPFHEFSSFFQQVLPTTQAGNISMEANDLTFTLQDKGVKEYISPLIKTTIPFDTLAARWKGDKEIHFSIKIQHEDDWSAWQDFQFEDKENATDLHDTDFLFTHGATALQYRIQLFPQQEKYPEFLYFQINYLQSTGNTTSVAQAASFTPLPRSAWGADENLRFRDGWNTERDKYCQKAPWACKPLSEETRKELQDKENQLEKDFPDDMKVIQTITSENGKELVWPQEYTNSKKLILHHTGENLASEDNQEGTILTEADYQARIRSVYYYHTIIRGWGDIGYNFIVTPTGTVYEGRAGGDRVVAAHTIWNNRGSVGISLMGNYEKNEISVSTINGIVKIFAYVAKKYGIDPKGSGSFIGKDIPNIVGHKDLAATSCPGTYLYQKIPALRDMTSSYLENKEAPISVPLLGKVNDANNEYSAEYISTDISDVSLSPTSSKTLHFRFKNKGTKTWTSNTYLMAEGTFGEGIDVQKTMNGNSISLANMRQKEVPSGSIADFNVTFQSGYREKVDIFTLTPVVDNRKLQSVFLPVEVNNVNYSYEVQLSQYSKTRLFFDETASAQVALKNMGTITWVNYGENAMILKPNYPSFRKTLLHPSDPEIFATLQEREVLPGQIGHFSFSLTAPQKIGVYEEHFAPFIKQIGYLEDKNMNVRIVVLDPQNALEYSFSEVNNPVLFLLPSEKKKITLTLQNSGNRRWNELQTQTINFFTYGLDGGEVENTVAFDKNMVAIGETVQMSFTLTTPVKAGRYTISLLPRIGKSNLLARRIEVTFYVRPPIVKATTVAQSLSASSYKAYDRVKVTLKVQNTGNMTWKKGEVNLGKLYNRDQTSPLYDASWISLSRPATLQEESVLPGETGTIEFYVTPKKSGMVEDTFQLGIQGIGWVAMTPITIRLSVAGTSSSNTNTNTAPVQDANLASVYTKDIKVKLSFPSDQSEGIFTSNTSGILSNGSQSISVPAGGEVSMSIEGSDVMGTYNENTIKGQRVTFAPDNNGIVTIKNWERYQAWDTNKQYNDNRFRGKVTGLSEDGKPVFVNELPLEDYLKGVAEVVANNTHFEKMKVMAILARTYALFYMLPEHEKFPGKYYDASDDPNIFQKYLGYAFELRSGDWIKALQETSGQIVTYEGKLIKTPYFNNSDGRTRSAEEVWGWKDTPYLQSVSDALCDEKVLRGHGVGLSGCGAEKAAQLGQKYDVIIQYYYQGVKIGKVE